MKRLRNFAVLSLALIPALVFSLDADAVKLSPRGCESYAMWSGNLVWASDLGAEKEKAREELVRLDQKTPSSIFALMLRHLDALWTTTASWEEVTMLVLQDCIVRGGIYEEAS
jgi:hypothetical protein